jgi:hypothetical protein
VGVKDPKDIRFVGRPISYDGNTNSYYFYGLNGNGIVDPNETGDASRYSFDARGKKYAYNLQLSKREPHGFIHNARSIAELLVDSIQHLEGDVAKYTWR